MNCLYCKKEVEKLHCSNCQCNFHIEANKILSIVFYTDDPSPEFEYIDYILNIEGNELIIQYLTTKNYLSEIIINHIPDINSNNLFEVFQRIYKLNAFL